MMKLDGAVFAHFAHFAQVALEARDAFLDAAAVPFALGLARAPRADAAGLAREVGPHAGEARQEIVQLGEFDLETAFAGAGPAGENIENEPGAVEPLAAGEFLQIAALGGREFVIKDERGGQFSPHCRATSPALPLPMSYGAVGLSSFWTMVSTTCAPAVAASWRSSSSESSTSRRLTPSCSRPTRMVFSLPGGEALTIRRGRARRERAQKRIRSCFASRSNR